MTVTITDELIRIIKRQQIKGVGTARLSAETRQLLFDPRARAAPPAKSPAGGSRPSASARPSPPAEASPALADAGVPVARLDWDALAPRVAHCRLCPLHQGRTRTVFEDGDRNARLMFIGEGPGRDEDEQGVPFVGPAGQLLSRMIEAMQFARTEVYIANIVKCRPPGNRNPQDEEAEACLPYLRRQIELVKPEVIVLLGAVPLRHLLGETGINRVHGQWRELEGIPVMPTFHPAYLLRTPERKSDAWQDLQKVMQRLGKDPHETIRRMRSKT